MSDKVVIKTVDELKTWIGKEVAVGRWLTGYGNTVAIKHELGASTVYAHLSAFLVKPGDRVAVGQTVGHVGATGILVAAEFGVRAADRVRRGVVVEMPLRRSRSSPTALNTGCPASGAIHVSGKTRTTWTVAVRWAICGTHADGGRR